MSLGVSLDRGRLEYSGDSLRKLFAQPANLVSGRFWTMLRDLLRFYRAAPAAVAALEDTPLDVYLAAEGYSAAFRDDHLYPMAAAIWSTPAAEIGAYPAAAFIRFCINHGLLQVLNRPRLADGGRRQPGVCPPPARSLGRPGAGGVRRAQRAPRFRSGGRDGPVGQPRLLRSRGHRHPCGPGAAPAHRPDADRAPVARSFRYSTNEAILHRDTSLMPKRKAVWSAWNYMSERDGDGARLSVTYWMKPSSGPAHGPAPFRDAQPATRAARRDRAAPRDLYPSHLQHRGDGDPEAALDHSGPAQHWYCGAHFGAGFHEDGLQAGLAVAEALGGVRRRGP